ncbi:MAG: methyltransferase domain-containing protein [SAR324 cluster bacterium]|nr:methyltransferase domain-containing protein [SAR324 cluster bacterium]
MSEFDKIESHWTRGNVGEAILAALAGAGKDLDNLRPEHLAAVDEFHIRGREATLELAPLLELDASKTVLDVGSGVGGPSRLLAADFGCKVTGLDLTEEYCQVATMLAERTGLGGLVEYRQGNALDMPFEDASFDAEITQHAAMNIPEKPTLYREMARVLKPGGLLGLYDVLAGAGGEVHFPVPWAKEPSISHLATPDELRELLESSGFEVLHWRDSTVQGRDWFRAMVKAAQEGGPPPLGFHLLLGPDFPEMAKNQLRNLEENRIALIETVCRKT